MRNAFNKDILREIRNTLGRFLGILAIVALGVSFYAGLGATGYDMKLTGDMYVDDRRLMDLRVICNYGINDKDLDALREIEGVEDVYPSYNIDAMVTVGESALILKAHSINVLENAVNKPVLISGRLPEKTNEVLVEQRFLLNSGYGIGDVIRLQSGKKTDIRNSLRWDKFVISGVIKSPYYISQERGSGGIGNGSVDCYIYLPEESFLQSVYSEVFIRVEDAAELMSFSDGYDDLIEAVSDRIEERTDLRVTEKTAEISRSRFQQLNAAESALTNQIAETEARFAEAEETINIAEAQLRKNENALEESRLAIETGTMELKASRTELYSGLAELRAGASALRTTIEDLEASRQSLRSMEQYMSAEEYQAGLSQLEAGLETAKAALTELELQESSLIHSAFQITASQEEIDAARELADGRRTIASAKAALEQQREEISAQKAEAEAGFVTAKAALSKTRSTLYDLAEIKYYVLNRDTNIGYSGYKEDATKIQAIAGVFPLIFFVVAALVSLTTMTRLVEERRGEVGTLKSLGYGNIKIMSKYLIYAFVPTMAGGLAGAALGMKLFPSLIINAYGMLYTIPEPVTPFNVYYAAIAISFALLCTVGAAFMACRAELKESPCNLMRPKAPKMGKRIWIEHLPFIWKNLNFTQKVTMRNIFRYKKRFYMTVIGISGCTALLVTGFGLRNSIADLMIKQYEEIYLYDMVTAFTDDAKQKDIDQVLSALNANQLTTENTTLLSKSMEAGIKGGGIENVSIIVPEFPEELGNFIDLHERISRQPVSIPDGGVVITEKLSGLLGAEIGAEIYIKDSDNNILDVRVVGICENYFLHNIYLSEGYYAEVFGEAPEYNSIYSNFAKNDSELENQLAAKILDSKGVSGISFAKTVRGSFADTVENLDFVVFVLIISAGLLAFVVLLNLTGINISERVRELATIEVLGFFDKEVSAYVFRENIVLTFIGTAVGLLFGIVMHRYIILTAETSIMMFSRDIRPMSFVYSAILTAAFSFSVNSISAGKLKKINMVEALKSVE